MILSTPLTEDIFALTANDRRTELFENLWPLPYGVSYNSYIIRDQKCALMDTINSCYGSDIVAVVEGLLGQRELDYLVLHHLEPDHSTEIQSVIRRYPKVKVVGNKRTFDMLKNYYLIDSDNMVVVEDGTVIDLGVHSLRFTITPWLHWPETMMSLETTTSTLFSGDAFGAFAAPGGAMFDHQTQMSDYQEHMLRYYTNVIGKYNSMVQKSIAKLEPLNIKQICPLHGIIWRSNPQQAIDLYKRWSSMEIQNDAVIIYGSMYGNNASAADYLARSLTERGLKGIKVFDVSKTHISYLLPEIWRSGCIVLGSSAYNGAMLPTMSTLVETINHLNICSHREFAIFGSSSWNGAGVKALLCTAQEYKWNLVADPAELSGVAGASKLAPFDALSEAIVARCKRPE